APARTISGDPSITNISPLQQRDRGLVNAAVARRDNAAAVPRRASLPGGNHSAGAYDDRYERDHVIRLEAGLDDEIHMTGCEHAVGVAVASVAGQPHGSFDATEGAALLVRHQEWARRLQHC